MLAVDIDNVLADTTRTLIRTINRRLHRDYRLERWQSYFIEDNLHGDDVAIDLVRALLRDPQFYRGLPVLKGAREGVALLPIPICYLSSRAPEEYDVTVEWLARHHFPKLPLLLAADKVALVEEAGLTTAVEDAPHQALALAQAGVSVFLLDYPYNHQLRHPAIRRVRHWGELVHLSKGVINE